MLSSQSVLFSPVKGKRKNEYYTQLATIRESSAQLTVNSGDMSVAWGGKEYFYSPLDGMLVQRRLLSSNLSGCPNNSLNTSCVEREAPWE